MYVYIYTLVRIVIYIYIYRYIWMRIICIAYALIILFFLKIHNNDARHKLYIKLPRFLKVYRRTILIVLIIKCTIDIDLYVKKAFESF